MRQKANINFSHEEILKMFTYNKESGLLYRNGKSEPLRRINDNDYIDVCIKSKTYRAHRIIWMYVYGVWPDGFIDHINGNKSDNRIENLRICTNSQNQMNRKVTSKSITGIKGVFSRGKRFYSQIVVSGKTICLGSFGNSLDAATAYNNAAIKYHGEFATLNPIKEKQ